MAISAIASPVPARPQLRFTLAGLFVCLLGIAVGLAYWRLPYDVTMLNHFPNRLPNALLAAFSVWFVIGMLQQAASRWQQFRQMRDWPQNLRWGLIVQMGAGVGMVAVLTLAGGLDITGRLWWWDFSKYHSDIWIAARLSIDATFILIVICAYWVPRRESRWRDFFAIRSWHLLLDGVAIVAATGVLAVFLMVNTHILGFVWIAIRGVENFCLPTRWMGHDLLVADIPDESFTDQFITGGMAAAGLLIAGMGAIALLVRGWRVGWVARCGCAILAAACLSGVAWLLYWCHDSALPRLSPTMAAQIGTQPPATLLLGWAFLLSAVTAMAIQLAVQRANIDLDATNQVSTRAPFLHERASVGAVCLVGIISGIAANMWVNVQFMGTIPPIPSWFDVRWWWRLLNYVAESVPIDNPGKLLSIAATLVLIRWFWRSYRGDLRREEQWSVEPRQFAAAWLGSFAILVLAGPVFAWWGFALTLKFYFQL